MESYSYIGIDTKGKEVKGSVEAEDKEKALAAVKQMGLIPTSVEAQNFLNRDISLSVSKHASVRDMSLFCRQFASLLRAGVTIVDALGMLSESTENKGLAEAIKGCGVNIQKGETLGLSMRNYPEYFNGMLVSLVDAGEASGSLDNSLDRMAIQFEKDAKLQGAMKKAMIYPIVVTLVAIGVIILMLVWVVPTFMKMFQDLDIDMPKITMAVVNLSDFVQHNILAILAVMIIAVVGFKFFKSSGTGQSFLSYLGVKLPAIGNFTTKSACARLARTLSTLIGSGLTMVEALEITAHTMTNTLYREAVTEAREEVLKGVPLSEPLKRSGLFPPMVIHMIKIGEDTGDMESMLTKLADYYDEEVELATQSLLAALEPIIIVFLALVVCFLIAAIFSPMVALYEGLDTL